MVESKIPQNNSKLSFALVTPSYVRDFNVCRLLTESVERHVSADIKHYLIVPREDYPLFKELESERTVIKFQEDFLPRWILPFRIATNWYISLRSLPIRGWIRQQLVKLAIGEMLPEDTFLIVDSDTFFVKPFSPHDFIRNGKVSFYCEPLENKLEMQANWQISSAKMLGISDFSSTSDIYVAPFIFWNKRVLQQMFERMTQVNRKSWQQVLCKPLRISEYTLYGVFVDSILGVENAGHFRDETKYTLDYYLESPMVKAEIEELKSRMKPEHYAVSISSKSNTDISLVRSVFNL